MEKLISPILFNKNKTKEIYELIAKIGEIFISKNNFNKIFQFEKDKRNFDNETIKKFLNIIYQIIENLLDKEDYNKNLDFKAFFMAFFNLVKKYTNDSLKIFYDDPIKENLLYLYENLLKIIKLKKDLFKPAINDFLCLLNQMKYFTNRKISEKLYGIISVLIEDDESSCKLGGICDLLDEKFLKVFFNENSELLSKIILRIDFKDINEQKHFNKLIITSLFNYALKSNQTKKLLDLLYKVINIKDEYTLQRLYLIMGFPQMIIEKQDYQNESDENRGLEDEDFWPAFGLSYLYKYETEEMYKYISNIKIYESHCILAQLFPCSDDSLYDNYNFIWN